MKMAFKAENASGMNATVQFDFTGEQSGSCSFVLSGDGIEESMGPAVKADLVVKTPFEVWMDVLTNKADGQKLFEEGKYQAEGDLAVLMKFRELYGR